MTRLYSEESIALIESGEEETEREIVAREPLEKKRILALKLLLDLKIWPWSKQYLLTPVRTPKMLEY